MAVNICLGSRFRLWLSSETAQAEHLVIRAHGSYFDDYQVQVPTWTQLVFYGPPDRSTSGPNIKDSLFYQPSPWATAVPTNYKVLTPYEIKRGNEKVLNYTLRKRQTHHGFETYADIQAFIERNRRQLLQYKAGRIPAGFKTMDVITIRNRFHFINATTLGHLLKTLERNNYLYKSIHCRFCRSHIMRPRPIYYL